MNDSEILICQAADGKIKIDVRLKDETVWLNPEKDRSTDVATKKKSA